MPKTKSNATEAEMMPKDTKAAIGAFVKYCGHEGGFTADIFDFCGVCVVKAGMPKITPDNLVRKCEEPYTHHLSDSPWPGMWCPQRGIFVVPRQQVTVLNDSNRDKF